VAGFAGDGDWREFNLRHYRTVLALALAVALLVCGCSGKAGNKAAVGRTDVEVGMSESQVLAIMGPPQRRESQGGTDFLIYAADDRSGAALLDFIPIVMVGGRVTGIGRHVYDHVVRAKMQSDLRPGSEPDNPRR
jgi:hypothetical protein